ncbi:MAG: DUF4276 family protein, partial [Planctomycetes bacterium]|nr:DUF4276 family protein [Planctomycetota bacterium]
MNRVLALVEGQTEQTFVRDVLAPELALRGVYLTARLIGKPGHKGGMRSYAAARHEILKLLQEDARRYCTTMFDYYRLPTDWPGRLRSTQLGVPDCALALEDATHGDICQKLGEPFDPRRFIPHVQLHEFEAMLFVAPAVVAKAAQAEHVAPRLQRILDEFRHPEAINDGPETSPSK